MPLISFFGVICMIPFMYIIIVYLVFISSIAKGLAMSRLGGVFANTSDIQIRKIGDFLVDVSFKRRCKCFRKI